MASATSKKTEIHLTNVALSSLEELREDFRDFLATHQGSVWDKDSKEAVFVRNLCRKPDANYENTYQEFMETRDANIVANIILCLINQTGFLLRRQIKFLEKQFLEQGGIREQMTQARLNARRQKEKLKK